MTEAKTPLPILTRAKTSLHHITKDIKSQLRRLMRRVLRKRRRTEMEVKRVDTPVAEVSSSYTCGQPGCPGHTRTVPNTKPFRFLDLPKELRLMVYEYLVVVGKVFYTPDWYELAEHKRFNYYNQYMMPSLDVFHVCKQIKDEAEDVYLSRNLFVLPYNFKKSPPLSMWCPNHSVRPVFSSAGLNCLRNLNVAFCNRTSAPLIMTTSDWASDDAENDSKYDDMSPEDRLTHAHNRAKQFLRSHWTKNVSALRKIRASLDTLEIDLSNAFCPLGCCREFDDIDFGFLCRLKPNTIRLLGVRTGEEEKLLTQMRDNTRDESGEETFLDKNCKVICNPEDDPWEKFRDPQRTGQARRKKGCNW